MATERRLIDMDETIKQLRDYADRKHANGHADTANGILKAVSYIRNNMVRVDAVEVVRCKDCKHGEVDDPDFPDQFYCHSGCGWNEGNFFCAYGEHKSGTQPQREE